MSQEIDNLPEHLTGIKFEPWHFYRNTKAKKGENQLLLNDCFIDEVMRMKKLRFIPKITARLPYKNNELYIEAEVTVYSTNDDGWVDESNNTKAFSSVTKMPHEGGQTHFAQIAITRALKTAVLRHLYISDHDIELAVAAYDITPAKVNVMTRSITNDGDSEETDKTPQTIEPEIDLDLGI
jgi:hypothetical protein